MSTCNLYTPSNRLTVECSFSHSWNEKFCPSFKYVITNSTDCHVSFCFVMNLQADKYLPLFLFESLLYFPGLHWSYLIYVRFLYFLLISVLQCSLSNLLRNPSFCVPFPRRKFDVESNSFLTPWNALNTCVVINECCSKRGV